jgi:transcriptional regulator with XRE-family HTH domain
VRDPVNLTDDPTPDPFRGKSLVDSIEEGIRPLSTARLGLLLREMRESRHFTLQDIVLLPQLRSELEAVEAGRLRANAAMVEILLHCYGAELDDLVPPRDTLVVIEGTDQEVLTKYLVAVRRARDNAKNPVLREADLRVLAGIIGTDPGDIQQRFRTHAIEERIAPLSTARLGVLVQKLRKSAGANGRQTAPASEVLQSQLEDVEAGRLRPDAAILEALLADYEANLDSLVPPHERLVVAEGTDEEVLSSYLRALRRWRGRGDNSRLREADLQVLAGILGTDPRSIQRRLRGLTGCSRRRARRLTLKILVGGAAAPPPVMFLRGEGPT